MNKINVYIIKTDIGEHLLDVLDNWPEARWYHYQGWLYYLPLYWWGCYLKAIWQDSGLFYRVRWWVRACIAYHKIATKADIWNLMSGH